MAFQIISAGPVCILMLVLSLCLKCHCSPYDLNGSNGRRESGVLPVPTQAQNPQQNVSTQTRSQDQQQQIVSPLLQNQSQRESGSIQAGTQNPKQLSVSTKARPENEQQSAAAQAETENQHRQNVSTSTQAQHQQQSSVSTVAQIQNPHQQSASTLAQIQDPQQQSASTLAQIQDPQQHRASTLSKIQDPQQQSASMLAQIQDPQQHSAPTLAQIQDPQQHSASTDSQIQDPQQQSVSTLAQIQDPQQHSASTQEQIQNKKEEFVFSSPRIQDQDSQRSQRLATATKSASMADHSYGESEEYSSQEKIQPLQSNAKQHHEEYVQPEQHQEKYVQPEQHQEEYVQPEQHQEEYVQPEQHQEEYVQPEQHQEEYVQPEQHQEEYVQPEQHQEEYVQPEQHQEEYVQPEQHQEEYVQPEQHQEEYVQPEQHQEEYVQPEQHQEEYVQPGQLQEEYVQPGQHQEEYVQPGQHQEEYVQPEQHQEEYVQPGQLQEEYVQPGQQQRRRQQQRQQEQPLATRQQNLLDLCQNCVVHYGLGYASYPGDCRIYVMCEMNGAKPHRAFVKKCPPGTAWSQGKIACDFPENVPCAIDSPVIYNTEVLPEPNSTVEKCRGDKKSIPGDDTGFLQLTGSGWVAMPCPPGLAYRERTCRCAAKLAQTDGDELCPGLKAIPGDPRGYLQHTGATWMRMPCPATLGYNATRCACTDYLNSFNLDVPDPEPTPSRCEPTLVLTFEEANGGVAIKDSSPNRFWVKNTGVRVAEGKAFFNGKSRLSVPGLNNMDLGSKLYIRIAYQQAANVPRPQTLVANAECDERQSIAVCSGQDFVSFYGETNGRLDPAALSVQKMEGPWQYAMYVLDSGFLQGYVGTATNAMELKGSLQRRPFGLIIGSGGDCEDFQGIIEEIQVHRCKPEA